MDDYSNQYVKQESLSSEEEFITEKALPSIKNMGHRIEPCLKVKEPPDNGERPIASSSAMVSSSKDNQGLTKNATNSFRNGFIIYELEDTSPMSKAHNHYTNNSIKMPSSRLLNNINDNRSKSRLREPFKTLRKTTFGAVLKESVSSSSSSSSTTGPKILNSRAKSKTTTIKPIDSQQCQPSLSLLVNSNIMETSAVSSRQQLPPILLNAQLGKRSQSINSTKNQTGYTIKKKCYNLEDLEQNQPNEKHEASSSKTRSTLNSPCKKIINYIMKNKYRLDLQTTYGEEEKGHLKDLKEANRKLHQSFVTKNSSTNSVVTPIKPENSNDDQQVANTNALLHSAPIADLSLDTHAPNCIKLENIQNNFNTSTTISQTAALSEGELSSSPLATMPLLTDKDKPLKSVESSSSKPRCELKVKCLCRLMGDGSDANLSPYDPEELKTFFHQMFEKTRKLPRQGQRKVKMSLLQAICEAEEMVEKGKCCCF